jgi:hypothetical protein
VAARLSDLLLGSGLVPELVLREAIARQAVYGGALDSALLELEALDEGRLWQLLSAATELPIPDPVLCERPTKYVPPEGAGIILDGPWSERCRAVPVAMVDGVLQLLCGEPIARDELGVLSPALGHPITGYVVPEVRLAAVRQAVFGVPMSPRLVRLFARVAGTQPVRLWQAAQTRPVKVEETTGVEIIASRVGAAPPAPAPSPAVPGPGGGRLSDEERQEVLATIARLKGRGKDGESAHAALVALTKQDFGRRRRKWEIWWEKHEGEQRIEWLFEGLSHETAEIRGSAAEELRALTGQYFGYHFDLARPEREAARRRWQSWYYEVGSKRRS